MDLSILLRGKAHWLDLPFTKRVVSIFSDDWLAVNE